MKLKRIAGSILFLYCSFGVHAQNVNDIISNYVKFIGGAKGWNSVRTMIITGTYDYGGIVFPFKSFSKAPNFYKYMVTSNGKSFEQGFDGKEGWKIDGFKNETTKTIVTGRLATAMANEADVELESPFINYREEGNQVFLVGQDTVNEQPCYKVKFIQSNGDTGFYFFSRTNFELAKKQAISKNQELDSSIVDIFYEDYRSVEEIKIPFKSVSKAGSQTILTITIEKVELNRPMADEDFGP
jgi:hypothetical protein